MPDEKSAAARAQVDLTTCDREPIHIIGQVQSFGCLIAVSADWIISHASANCAEVLGLDETELAGRPVTDILSPQALHDLRTRMQMLRMQQSAVRVFGYDLRGDGQKYDVSIHQSGRLFVLEFERRGADGGDVHDPGLVQALIGRVQRHGALDAMAQEAARGLKALSGFGRVMVYKFEEDGSGTVIAEARESGMEPFLGLRYPASDIPKQARALYVRSLLRIIPDVAAPVYPVQPETDPNGEPLDLSLAVTRAVSPIHVEYLRNMGVAASMSVSILRNGQLWGLFACHNDSPCYLSYEKRTSVELFAQLFNYELAQMEMTDELGDIDRSRALHDNLMPQLSNGCNLFAAFEDLCSGIGDVIPFDGAAIYSDGQYKSTGSAPVEEEFLGLVRFLNTTPPGQIYSNSNLIKRYPAADGFADRVAGLLAIPVSRKPRDYFVLFRREVVKSVTWAGNPEKPVEPGPNGLRLTPRKSFEAWKEVARGHCHPWKQREQRTAEALRTTLIEVVLKLADENNAARKRAQDQQELLIAELNHRVRNILNLIRGLVSQGKESVKSADAFGEVLDARIHALARAHDQLTGSEWDWSPLTVLIGTETEAFLAGKASRVSIDGDALELSPAAFTCVALVVHELVTNSVKYGALSDSSGRVEIRTALNRDGTAALSWREHDGPPVKAPERRGFGTTLIEQSVPFELQGEADVRYRITGLEADFLLPARHVRKAEKPAGPVPDTGARQAPAVPRLSGGALVLEDNMIIAMDAADMLTQLGAEKVETCSGVTTALNLLEQGGTQFVLADMNLGSETSLPVVERCRELGVAVVLATGYGSTDEVTKRFPGLNILKKPYTVEQLSAVLETMAEAENGG
ncbi:GAF domain-containing protein (plasmid) [Leisingera caerulea]|uniref:HWE histidine kinase domain-containing protein n=1 Tax=Leisingera caerulea TaxID=506591 RepID=UPI0021A7C32E|nr:HWE histidine kinase domain-containing protein [Leisingera caerulea]UWQ52204.1 GAF domain-containing protein [Leisingera caerulea]